MKNRMIAIALCLVMVSAFAMAGTATAKPATKSNDVVKYRVFAMDQNGPTDTVVGTLSYNHDSGQWILNAKGEAAAFCAVALFVKDSCQPSGWSNAGFLNPDHTIQASKSGSIHDSGLVPNLKRDAFNQLLIGTEGVDYAWVLGYV
ncbi:MAG: hypothetical protein ACXV3E_02000 [Halobacteriota archaeon]